MQKTFTILKPDTVHAAKAGAVIGELEKAGFRIRAMKMLHLTEAQAQGFYYVHKERPFFGSLVKFMTEGPVIIMVLEATTRLNNCGRSWAQRIRRRPMPVRFGNNLEPTSSGMRFTVPTGPRRRPSRS